MDHRATKSEDIQDIPGKRDSIPCLQVSIIMLYLNLKIMLVCLNVPISSERPGVSIDVLKILTLTPSTPGHSIKIVNGGVYALHAR